MVKLARQSLDVADVNIVQRYPKRAGNKEAPSIGGWLDKVGRWNSYDDRQPRFGEQRQATLDRPTQKRPR